jgi:type VI secretion system secreted protein VgrG
MADAGGYTQERRLFSLETPLGPDRLLVRSMRATESMSQLFQCDLDLVSDDLNIDFRQIIGQPVTIGIKMLDETNQRTFHGHVKRFTQTTSDGRLACYQAEVVPWLWFLTKTADCYIYQHKTVPDIIADIFKRSGFRDFEPRFSAKYDTWEYCVQYRETAFNFVSRLMEIEGIFYFFRQEKGKHILVLADSPTAHRPCPVQARFKFEHVFGSGVKRGDDTVFKWRRDQSYRFGKYTHTEYNFETPSASLRADINTRVPHGGNPKYEVYDYPGEYERRPEADPWGKLRMEEEETAHESITGEGNCRALIPGFRFELYEHERRDQNGTYVVTSVTHEAHEGGLYSGVGASKEKYKNTFTCIPYSTPFRPPRLASKPVMRGSQTAFVVGPPGEEIHVDNYGRVRVQFHWDREGKRDQNSSCFMRVAQPWAGKNWGAMWIPRIGQEVIVDFLEGDPDRPIITGRVYNAESMPPYELPKHQTRSTFKSRSSKGGTPANFNELRFEDKKNEEQILLHAERDMDHSVERDSRELVGRDRNLIVERDQRESVEGEKHSRVGKDRVENVGGNLLVSVEGRHDETVGTRFVVEAGDEIHLCAGSKIVLEAPEFSMLGSGGFIGLGPGGVVIQGTVVLINSGGGCATGTSASVADPKKPDRADEGK